MKYSASKVKIAGVAIPLSGIRTKGSWCTGEYPDLVPLAALCAGSGLKLIQLLPINDSGGQSSPYSALSAFALHPLYIRVADLAEAAAFPAVSASLAAYAAKHQRDARFSYRDAYRVKMDALRAVFDGSKESITANPELQEFIAAHPWVKTYAVYKRLKKNNGDRSWRDWHSYRDPTATAIATLWNDPAMKEEHLFYVWMQLRCAGQCAAASTAIRDSGITLLGDLPILMNDDSADVWSNRQYFTMNLRAGAPPDMFSHYGQNWGFPVYNWEKQEADDFSFWKNRVAEASAYYSAYRIDHVLGFFRIWAMSEFESDGYLGHFHPEISIASEELRACGFTPERLRWLSLPHVRGSELRAALENSARVMSDLTISGESGTVPMFERLGSEDLYLFTSIVRGTLDIDARGFPGILADFLKHAWRDRVLQPLEGNSFVPTWRHSEAYAWASLSVDEQGRLERLFSEKQVKNGILWAERGKKLLAVLVGASDMLACAEDLGAVPDCVPAVLAELGIPGLKIPRWSRLWNKDGQPYESLSDFRQGSVCAVSVHDTSTLREWWEFEEGRNGFAAAYCPELRPVPEKLDAKTAFAMLRALARSASSIFVAQMQDYLDVSDTLRSVDPRDDRVNIPGTQTDINWTWRMRWSLEDLLADKNWVKAIAQIADRT